MSPIEPLHALYASIEGKEAPSDRSKLAEVLADEGDNGKRQSNDDGKSHHQRTFDSLAVSYASVAGAINLAACHRPTPFTQALTWSFH